MAHNGPISDDDDHNQGSASFYRVQLDMAEKDSLRDRFSSNVIMTRAKVN